MTTRPDAAIAATLFAAFGLPPPAPAARYPAVFTRPAKPALPTVFHPDRLALAGSVTHPRGTRR